jgi:HEAT repeat protein
MACAKLEDWLLIQRRESRRARAPSEALWRRGARSREALEEHARRLREGSLWARYYAALALEDLGERASSVIPDLVAALRQDLNPSVRLVAARALGRLGSAASAARAPLEEARRDPSGPVRRAASSALSALTS